MAYHMNREPALTRLNFKEQTVPPAKCGGGGARRRSALSVRCSATSWLLVTVAGLVLEVHRVGA